MNIISLPFAPNTVVAIKKCRDVLPLFPSFFDRFRKIRQPNCDAFYEAGNIDPFYDLEMWKVSLVSSI